MQTIEGGGEGVRNQKVFAFNRNTLTHVDIDIPVQWVTSSRSIFDSNTQDKMLDTSLRRVCCWVDLKNYKIELPVLAHI